jgi:hypothetical protein
MKMFFYRLQRSVRTLGVIAVVTMVAACSKNEEPETTFARSVLVYISAQNTLAGNVDDDVIEMLSAVSAMDENDRLVLFLDDNNHSRFYEITKHTTARTLYNLTPVYQYDSNLNSATPEDFDRVLNYFFQNYTAESYGLVMWSHGSGWINGNSVQNKVPRRSFAVDTNQGTTTRMNITDMGVVMHKYPQFEYIMFDACFMQTVEVAYELRATAKYLIGSPAEIPGRGAPYNLLMPIFFRKASPDNLAQGIVNAYGNYFNGENSYYGGVVLSAIKTDELDGFVDVMAVMFDRYSFMDPTDTKYADCQNYYDYTWNKTLASSSKAPDEYDIKGIMQRCVTDSSDYVKWEAAFNKLVPYRNIGKTWYSAYTYSFLAVDQTQSGGVSMFIPLDKYKNDYYFDFYKETQWGKLYDIK